MLMTDKTARLPRLEGMSRERRGVWERLAKQMGDAALSASPFEEEERVRGDMERASAKDPDLCVAVGEGWGNVSLMHLTALKARTEALVRCVWECCGERALQVMRHNARWGYSVLLYLAMNPNMTRGMYAVFAEHCTNDDLRAADNWGWSVLFRMAFTCIEYAETEEQEENMASVMCAVVQRLGPGALDAETAKDRPFHDSEDEEEDKYPAGSTPRSILFDAGGKGRALLQRLEEATARSDGVEADAKVGEEASLPRATPQSAAAPAPARNTDAK